MKSIRKFAVPAFALMTLAVIALVPEAAVAAEQAKDVAKRLNENVSAVKSLALSVIFLVGLIVFGLGVWLIYKDTKQPNQGHAKTGMIGMLVGAILLAVPTAIGVTGATFFGSSKAEDNVSKESTY